MNSTNINNISNPFVNKTKNENIKSKPTKIVNKEEEKSNENIFNNDNLFNPFVNQNPNITNTYKPSR